MTKTEFIILCNENLICPSFAIENNSILKALKSKNDNEVVRIIKEDF